MAILTTGNTFASGDQVTAATLNSAVNDAEFAAGAVDNTSTQLSGTSPQQIIVKDLGISTGKIATGAVTTDKINAGAVTTAKIASDVVINTSGSITGAAGSFTTLTASDDANFDSGTLFVDASADSVGIGTVSPSNTLHIENTTSSGAYINYDGQSNTEFGLRVESNASGGNFESDFVTGGTALLDLYANSAVVSGGDLLVARTQSATPVLLVKGNGNVGIGTADPDYLLDINDDAATGVGIRVTGGGGGGPLARFIRDVVSSGTVEINIAGGDPQFKLTSAGSDVFAFGVDDSANSFQICSGSAVGSNVALAVTSSSNVGIGTDLPSHRLDVNSGGTNQVALFESTDATAYIELADNTGSVQFITPSSGALRIATGGTGAGSVGTSGLFIDQSQNVGIGDDTPSYKLDVNGTGRFVNDLTLDEELIHNLSGAGSFPGYSAGTFGAVLEDGGTNGSSLYMSRKNSWALYLATDTTLNAQSDKVVQFADLNGQSGDQDNVVGSITITSSSTAYNTSSDYRLKENTVDIADGISRLKQLKPYRFNFTRDPSTTVDGFFAHEVSSVVPESISGEKDQVDDEGNPVYQGIDQSKLVPLLTAALQEAVAKIEALEARVQTLEG
jgi:hypothetical protein